MLVAIVRLRGRRRKGSVFRFAPESEIVADIGGRLKSARRRQWTLDGETEAKRGGLLGTRCDLVQMEVVQLELIDQVFST